MHLEVGKGQDACRQLSKGQPLRRGGPGERWGKASGGAQCESWAVGWQLEFRGSGLELETETPTDGVSRPRTG